MGWRRLFESQLVNRPTNSRPSGPKQQSLTARLGDSFYFAISKIVESLLRRGARGFSLHFATQTQQKPLWGRSARESWSWLGNRRELPLRRAGGASRHSVLAIRPRKQSLAARLGDSFYFAISKIVESLLRRGARDFSLHFATQTQQKPLWGRRAGGAARHSNRASRLQPALSARWRILAKQHELFRQYPTPAVARGIFERTALKPRGLRLRRGGAPIGRFIGHPGEKFATKNPVFACRAAP